MVEAQSNFAQRQVVRGFTLIEMLVVIVIIGVMVATATLSIGVVGKDSEMEDAARRLEAVVKQAREEAELQGLEYGIVVAKNAYQFVQYNRRKAMWEPVSGDGFYQARELPPGLGFRLWLDSKEIILKPDLSAYATSGDGKDHDKDKDKDKDKNKDDKLNSKAPKLTPHIMVLSSGEVMPFELRIERDSTDTQWHIVAAADNSISAEAIKPGV